MTYTATYSPEDNNLRLYSSTRLGREVYARVRGAGFIYAPKQELFVAPMWTPEREDFLIELCGEIDDENTSLVERAEERADRFVDYKDIHTTSTAMIRSVAMMALPFRHLLQSKTFLAICHAALKSDLPHFRCRPEGENLTCSIS
jgi:hypothetical protein